MPGLWDCDLDGRAKLLTSLNTDPDLEHQIKCQEGPQRLSGRADEKEACCAADLNKLGI